ncbi:MAG: MMPL family transporter [Micropepsaceae bacterium]
MLASLIARIASLCVRNASTVLAATLMATLLGAAFVSTHFRMNTDTTRMVSPELDWRKRQAAFEKLFPQPANQILIVIDGATPELAQQATAALSTELLKKPNLILSLRTPGGGPFFEQNGLLFLDLGQTQSAIDQIIAAQPFLGALAADPSMRGIMGSLTTALAGVEHGQITLDRLTRPLSELDATLTALNAGKPVAHSWRRMMMEGEPDLRETRRIMEVLVRLNFGALKPGSQPSDYIRATASRLGLVPQKGVTIRLTGPVPIFDEEFGSLTENALPIASATVGFMLLMLWLALRSAKLIIAVIATILAGLIITTALGLAMLGAFNIISVAFIALFVGLGVDFGIQLCVRYRAQRHETPNLDTAIAQAARDIGPSLTLAALAISAGFFGFIPTDYRGVAELGLVAGTGMLVTYLLSLTLLPAFVSLLKPGSESAETGYASLAPLDDLLRARALEFTAGAVLLGGIAMALLPAIAFDFNLLNLRSRKSESISTLLDLAHDPDRSPNAMDTIAKTRRQAVLLAARLSRLPDVAKVVTIETFIPPQQEEKLALIADASMLLDLSLNPIATKPAPSDAEIVASIRETAAVLRTTASSSAATASRHVALSLATHLDRIASAPTADRNRAAEILMSGLHTMLTNVRNLLQAQPVTLEAIPPEIARDFVAPTGEFRLRIYPKGDPTNNELIHKFRQAVSAVVPDATGVPVFLEESGNTIVGAFVQAGFLSLLVITLLLAAALRSLRDILVCLLPLVLAGALTLATCVLIGLKLNYANIIALPLLFGIGVAFDIYFVMAWRQGKRNLLRSPLTRAVMFSALATSSGFGALWFSSHPGTSSMGALLIISLMWILLVVLFALPPLLTLTDKK